MTLWQVWNHSIPHTRKVQIPSEIQRRRSTRSPLTAAQKSSGDEDEATHTLSICSSRPTQRSSDQAPPRRVRFSDDDEVDSVDRGLTGDFGDVD